MLGAVGIFLVLALVIYLVTFSPLAPAFEALASLLDALSFVWEVLGFFVEILGAL